MKKVHKQILVVDDDPDYTYLIEEALSSCKPCPNIKVLPNGPDLLAWLQTSQRPSLIFLDINLPGRNGLEVLKSLKVEEKYRTIPVIMLTVSEEKQDVMKSYASGANGFVTKPMTFDQLVLLMEVFSKYWFDIAKTPDADWPEANPSTKRFS